MGQRQPGSGFIDLSVSGDANLKMASTLRIVFVIASILVIENCCSVVDFACGISSCFSWNYDGLYLALITFIHMDFTN